MRVSGKHASERVKEARPQTSHPSRSTFSILLADRLRSPSASQGHCWVEGDNPTMTVRNGTPWPGLARSLPSSLGAELAFSLDSHCLPRHYSRDCRPAPPNLLPGTTGARGRQGDTRSLAAAALREDRPQSHAAARGHRVICQRVGGGGAARSAARGPQEVGPVSVGVSDESNFLSKKQTATSGLLQRESHTYQHLLESFFRKRGAAGTAYGKIEEAKKGADVRPLRSSLTGGTGPTPAPWDPAAYSKDQRRSFRSAGPPSSVARQSRSWKSNWMRGAVFATAPQLAAIDSHSQQPNCASVFSSRLHRMIEQWQAAHRNRRSHRFSRRSPMSSASNRKSNPNAERRLQHSR